MRTRLTLTAALLASTIALPAAAAVASSLADSNRDVWKYDVATGQVQRNTTLDEADIARVVAMTPADTGRGSSTVTLQLETVADPAASETLLAWIFGTEGSTDVQQGRYAVMVSKLEQDHAFIRNDGGDEVGCPGSSHRWLSARLVEVTFDSACIGAPRSLPIGAQSIAFGETAFWTDYAPNVSNPNAVQNGTADPVQPPAMTLTLPGHGTRITPVGRSVTSTCTGAPSGRFSDTSGNPHATNIDCAAHRKLSSGKGDGRYAPAERLRRDQIATFLANTLRAGGVALPSAASAGDYYADDEGNIHEDNINILTAADVLPPTADGSYHPGGPVSRSDMAEMVANALELDHAQVDPAPDYFTDDDTDPNEPAIGRVAQEGIVTGKGGSTYAPADTLRRDQMATFLVRLLDALS